MAPRLAGGDWISAGPLESCYQRDHAEIARPTVAISEAGMLPNVSA